jgi:Sigma-70, region 4
MSAALQLPYVRGAASPEAVWKEIQKKRDQAPAVETTQKHCSATYTGLGFYRKHTESLLRRYLYASMLVGRTPELLRDSVGRGWASSRPIRTFEDAVIFVLDVESCLKRLNPVDRRLLTRIVLQDYTHQETADLLGIALRTVSWRFPQALDRLTRLLLDSKLLVLPN